MLSADDPEGVAEFRHAYRQWLAAHVPKDWRSQVEAGEQTGVDIARAWMRQLRDGGYAAPSWPVEYGGMAASLAQQIVMFEENERADAPSTGVFGIALNHAGATLIVHGTAEQTEHLPRILAGEEIWCQGFSEPNAGSDLASLQTRAVLDGDHYVVTGQKVWSSGASSADWCLLLVRTNTEAPKHKGITFLLLDLRSPGVDVRPLRQITGSAEFCEIFLDDVAVPVANRVGPENEGWKISQTTLSTERGPFFLASVRGLHRQLEAGIDVLRATTDDKGRPLTSDPRIRDALARDAADVEILSELYSTILAAQLRKSSPGPEASILKLAYTELLHRLTGDVVDALGVAGQMGTPLQADSARGGSWMLEYLGSWGLAIGGGSSEIQRNLIAERVLGLPREPR